MQNKFGEFQTDLGEMGDIAVNYFQDIFESIQPSEQDIDSVVKTMRSKVDHFINQDLSRLYRR